MHVTQGEKIPARNRTATALFDGGNLNCRRIEASALHHLGEAAVQPRESQNQERQRYSSVDHSTSGARAVTRETYPCTDRALNRFTRTTVLTRLGASGDRPPGTAGSNLPALDSAWRMTEETTDRIRLGPTDS